MDLIDKRDEVLRTFLEYGITDCEWCDLKKSDLADCAEAIVKNLTIQRVSDMLPINEIKDYHIRRWNNGLDTGASMKEIREDMKIAKKAIDLSNSIKWT